MQGFAPVSAGKWSHEDLPAGQEARANFTLNAEPIYQVSGVVNRYEDLAGLAFTRRAGESFDFTQNAAVQNGKFQTKGPAGAYGVRGFSTTEVSLSTAGSATVLSHCPMCYPVVTES